MPDNNISWLSTGLILAPESNACRYFNICVSPLISLNVQCKLHSKCEMHQRLRLLRMLDKRWRLPLRCEKHDAYSEKILCHCDHALQIELASIHFVPVNRNLHDRQLQILCDAQHFHIESPSAYVNAGEDRCCSFTCKKLVTTLSILNVADATHKVHQSMESMHEYNPIPFPLCYRLIFLQVSSRTNSNPVLVALDCFDFFFCQGIREVRVS